MHEVGITGGIGSGKTTVAKVFETLGYLVYYADDRAKYLLNHHPKVIESIQDAFGPSVYGADGLLDRKALAAQVFNDKEKLATLNGIVHPATRQDFTDWVANIPAEYPKRFILKEAAILFEAGTSADLEAVISVYAPKATRIQRVISRDGTSEEHVLARMKNQWTEGEKLRRSMEIVYNDGEHPIIPQVMAIAQRLETMFARS